jgi:Ca-activated chloride channel homolog
MRMILLVLILCGGMTQALAAAGAGDVAHGNDFYRQGKFKEAAEHYARALEQSPSEVKIEYNLGAAAYKAGDYDSAVEYFQKGLLTDDDKLVRDVHFNMGDAYYRSGMDKKDKDIQAAIKQLEKSLGSFEKVRALDLKDKEAAENYEFVKKELERLKEQQKEQEQQQKQQQQKQDQQKQDQAQQQGQGQDKKEPSKEDQAGQQDKSSSEQEKDKGKEQEVPDQKKEGQGDKDQGQDNGKPEQKEASAGQNDEGKISSQKDANAMVDDLERNELPKGLLNFVRQPRGIKPVEKDW